MAMAAANVAHFVLNVVTADEGSRPGKPGGSARGRRETGVAGGKRPAHCAPSKSSPGVDYFSWANRRCPAKDEFLKLIFARNRLSMQIP
jgi:hypothetical protein